MPTCEAQFLCLVVKFNILIAIASAGLKLTRFRITSQFRYEFMRGPDQIAMSNVDSFLTAKDILRLLPKISASKRFFISGTYDDLEVYRKIVAAGIKKSGNIPIEPHDECSSAQVTKDFIDHKLGTVADAYVGMFGLRYGSPILKFNESSCSYSEYEYYAAREKFTTNPPYVPPPPIFIINARKGSELYLELERINNAFWKPDDEDCQSDWQADRDKDLERQQAFVSEISQENRAGKRLDRVLIQVDSPQDVEDKLANSIILYVHDFIAYGRQTSQQIEAMNPGLISRGATTNAPTVRLDYPRMRKILKSFDQISCDWNEPAFCALVNDNDAGLLRYLMSAWKENVHWDVEHEAMCDYMLRDGRRLDPEDVAWDALQIGPSGEFESSLEELAEELTYSEGRTIVMLHNIQRKSGRLKHFIEKFWKPLHSELQKRRADHEGDRNHSLMILLSHLGPLDRKKLGDLIVDFDGTKRVDFSKVCILPNLNAQEEVNK